VFVGVVLILPTEDERAAGHDERRYTTHDEHRQALHLRYSAGEPVYRCGGDEYLEYEQPAAVDERGNVRRARGAITSYSACGTRGQPDRQQGHAHAGGIEEIVSAFRQYRQRMSRHACHHKGSH
jgi:hypothetical protein